MYEATLAQAEPWIENDRQRFRESLDEIASRFPRGCAIDLANIYAPTDNLGDAQNAGLPHWPDG